MLSELSKSGIAIILVEQNIERALSVADNVCVLEAGNPTFSGSVEAARGDRRILEAVLGHE